MAYIDVLPPQSQEVELGMSTGERIKRVAMRLVCILPLEAPDFMSEHYTPEVQE